MPHFGRVSGTPTRPAPLVTCLVLVAVAFFHGPAFAKQIPIRGQRKARSTRGLDPTAQRARDLLRSIKWEEGPETVGLGAIAEIKVSQGFVFTAAEGGRAFLEVCRRPAPKELLGILAPSGSFDWYVVFVSRPAAPKVDGTGKIDADALLRQLREEDEADNAVRRQRGWAEFKDVAWERPPSYNERTRTLSWATTSTVLGRRVVRPVTRLLGQSGAIDAHVLVADEDYLTQVEPTVANILTLVQFADDPNFGAGREAQAVKASSSSSSSASVTTYSGGATYGGAASAGAASRNQGGFVRSVSRSPRTIGGFITAFCSAVGAAFRKKRSTAS